ncbi:O-linked N-acetylglucosamine transferase, SPINDLY family protein [Polynucleobacter necessarius]|uniref:O-linked N-acetylglucosamine transferase, SPINDLY family protein n=1 Tax=Polynucleobacter necessarius TaxID=576610 RepID=UPI000E09C446|nr:tetratricopeptide repeat protein [Polynucleobacter necessarius]
MYEKAVEQFHIAKAIQDNVPEVFFNLGKLHECLGDRKTAFAQYEKVLELDHNFVPAWVGGGAILQGEGKLDAALSAFDKALTLSPDYAEALFLKGNVLRALRRYQEALDAYSKCLSIDPKVPFVLGAYANTKMLICDWSHFDEDLDKIKSQILQSQEVIPPFPLLALIDDPDLQLMAAKTWTNNENKNLEVSRVVHKDTHSEKIRIGYFSADFGFHPVAFLIAEIFELHNRQQFEIYGFSTGPNTEDPMRKRLEQSFDEFIDVHSWSDAQIAAKARDLKIDIAIDLTGFTQDGRTNIFALGAAPVQVNFLGYPGTLGASYMDYIIVDPVIASENNQRYYAEKLAFLPDAYQPNDRKRTRPKNRVNRNKAGLPEQDFIFCCFNNNFKITPHQLDLWASILKQVEGSFLWLLEDNPMASQNLRYEISKRGVSIDRLIFASRVAPEDHLHRMSAADLFLDTSPYNAYTTASEALWVGLPILTRIGKSFCSRVAASLIRAAGVPELITTTDDEYVELAVNLARSPSKLDALKWRLGQAQENAPLFDSERFTRNLENLYLQMHEKSELGQPPAQISVFEGKA